MRCCFVRNLDGKGEVSVVVEVEVGSGEKGRVLSESVHNNSN